MSIRPQDNRDGDVYMISFPRFASDSLWRCEYEYGRVSPNCISICNMVYVLILHQGFDRLSVYSASIYILKS